MFNFTKKIKKLSDSELNTVGLIFFVIIFCVVYVQNMNEEKDFDKKKKITAGKFIKIYGGSNKSSPHLLYSYFINGEKIESSDISNTSSSKRVRLSKPIKGKYYPVEYDSLNPKNSRILITKEPLNPKGLIIFGENIMGNISKISYYKGNQYADLYINYKFRNQKFSFRTRLHKDSLSCGKIDDCRKRKSIELRIASKYPIFNNLYFKSRDRQNKSQYTNYK